MGPRRFASCASRLLGGPRRFATAASSHGRHVVSPPPLVLGRPLVVAGLPFSVPPPRPSPWQRARCWSLCKYVPSSRASSGPYAHRLPSPIPPHIPIRLRPVGAAWVARSRSPCNGNGSGLALRCVLSFRLRSKRSRVAALGLRPRRPLSACLPSSACVVLVPPCRRFAAWLSPLCCAVACRRGACLCLHVSLRCPVCRST